MSLTKTLRRIREDLEVTALDMENLDRGNFPDYVHRRRTWFKTLFRDVELIDSILNFKKGKDGTKKRKTN